MTMNNSSGSSIFAGFVAGQLIVDGDGGVASFATGSDAIITINNNASASIESALYDAGQLVVIGDDGNASFTLGDRSTLTVYNDGNISADSFDNLDPYRELPLAGQIVFDGTTATNGITFTTGEDVVVTAIMGDTGFISTNQDSPISPAQIYFRDTTIVGNPTINAILERYYYEIPAPNQGDMVRMYQRDLTRI